MSRFAAFLRGMNVGGHRITNAELARAVEALGLEEVATFRASGNLVFESGGGGKAELAGLIESGLGEALGYAVPVFLRSAEEVTAIAALRPFTEDELAASAGKVQVSLLREPPPPAEREAVLALASERDRLAVEGREVYWLPSGRMSDSELDLAQIAARTGQATMRTQGTIEAIAARHFGG